MIPRVVVFDLGKVLVDFDYGIAARRIAARGTASAAEVQRFIDHSPLLYRYETGEINRQQFYEHLRGASGFEGGIEEFGTLFADIFTPIEPMVRLQARVRAQGAPTFIFSNTNDLAVAHIRTFPFFSNFDGYILSYEQGAMKPDPKVYAAVEGMTGATGKEILFLDDRAENIATAQAREWQTIHHREPGETEAVLARLGLLAG